MKWGTRCIVRGIFESKPWSWGTSSASSVTTSTHAVVCVKATLSMDSFSRARWFLIWRDDV
eukprot:1145824-Pelagomonas_calceolata.AAC.1